MIYLIYGQPGSGKTTLGNLLAGHLNTPFVIDGDEFRSFFVNRDYGFGGRKRNIRSANAVATYLNKKPALLLDPLFGGDVVMCLVNPYEQFRNELKEDNAGQVTEIMVFSGRSLRKEHHVKDFEKGHPDCIINTDQETEDTWNYLKSLLHL